jgi:hypothetical protein
MASLSYVFFHTLNECCKVHYGCMLSECKGTFGLGSHKWYINRIDSGTDLGGCVDYFAGKTCRPAKMSAMQRDI